MDIKIGSSDCAVEADADRMATQVLQGQAVGAKLTSDANAAPRRVPGLVDGVEHGRPLDAASLAYFEPRFGADFAGVRIFAGPSAAQSARTLGAQAYTAGTDIVFGREQYQPGTFAGRALLAHELAHVAQQKAGEAVAHGVVYLKKNDEAPVASPAEVQRLVEEMRKLAADNKWEGVAEAYEDIKKMGDEAFGMARDPAWTPAAIHYLGAEAARNLGDTQRYKTLLLRAQTALGGAAETDINAAGQLQTIGESLANVAANFGVVRIAPRSEPRSEKKSEALRGPELAAVVMPIAPDQSASIGHAKEIIIQTGHFSGLLPVGEYTLGTESFRVIAGDERSVLWGE